VERCGLRKIELGAFNGLTELTELSVARNEISEIIPGTFDELSSLEHLSLEDNGLKDFNSDVFRGLVKLKHINLGGNNLQNLHPDTFLSLPNIQNVYLYNNPRLEIPTDSNFINSFSLSHLDISNCTVSSLSVETFANVSALEWLDLSYNNLSTVDINILKALPKLSTVFLYNNPLQCDGQLQEVRRWCEDHRMRIGYLNISTICDTHIEEEGILGERLEQRMCFVDIQPYFRDHKISRHGYSFFHSTDMGTDTKQRGFVSSFLQQYQVMLYAVPFIFGTTGNVILLIMIICNKDMRTVPNMYILNLAISDIIYLTVLFSESCANSISDTWLDDEFICKFLPFCRRLSVFLTAYSITMFSIQRYRVTVNPLQVRVSAPPTWRGIVAKVCGVWIVAALLAVPSALSKYQCEEFAIVSHVTYFQLKAIFELSVSCVLPLCVIVFTHIMTARHLVESSHPISAGPPHPQLKRRRNSAKIVVGLTVVFLVSYVPYHVFWTYIISTIEVRIFSEKINEFLIFPNHKLRYMYLISTGSLLLNSCLNPVALFCTSSTFRQRFKRYVTCFCKINSAPTEIELRRRN
jgi:hypothetical protein